MINSGLSKINKGLLVRVQRVIQSHFLLEKRASIAIALPAGHPFLQIVSFF